MYTVKINFKYLRSEYITLITSVPVQLREGFFVIVNPTLLDGKLELENSTSTLMISADTVFAISVKDESWTKTAE